MLRKYLPSGGAVLTFLLLIPLPVFAVNWRDNSQWATLATTNISGGQSVGPFTMTGTTSVSANGIYSDSDNASTDGFLEVSVGTKQPQGGSQNTLTATLTRRFRSSGNPASALNIDYFFYSAFGSNPPDNAFGRIDVNVFRSGGDSYNQTQTVNITPINNGGPAVIEVGGQGTLTFGGLAAQQRNYRITITITYDSGPIGNSWNRTDTGITISPHRFTFSGG